MLAAQISAFALVAWRGFWRGGGSVTRTSMATSDGARASLLRRIAGVVLVSLRAVLLSVAALAIGASIGRLTHDRDAAAALFLLGCFGLVVAAALREEKGSQRQDRGRRIEAELIGALPVSPHVRVLGGLARGSILAVPISAALAGLDGQGEGDFVTMALLVGPAFTAVAVLTAEVLARLAALRAGFERLVPAFRLVVGLAALSILWLAMVRALAGPAADEQLYPRALDLLVAWWPFWLTLAAPIAHSCTNFLSAAQALAGLSAAAAVLYTVAVSLRSERAPEVTHTPSHAFLRETLTLAGLERLASRRSEGLLRRLLGPLIVVIGCALLGSGVLAYGAWSAAEAWRVSVNLVMFVATTFALRDGSVSVRRDVAVRSLLAALPVAPSAALFAKVRLVRQRVLLLCAGLVLPGLLFALEQPGAFAFDVAIKLGYLWLVSEAAVSVAFLTQGNGAPEAATLGASRRFEQGLLALPMLNILASDSWQNSAFSLLSMWVLTREARRASLRSVRWLDDGDESHGTPAWRALLVFASVYPLQALLGVVLGLGFGESLGEWTSSAIYAGSFVVLLAFTLSGRQHLPAPSFWPKRSWTMLLGPGVGAASASLAWLYLRSGSGVTPSSDSPGELAPLWALLVTSVVLAPIAEELYFRGWLQPAMAIDLFPSRRWLAAVPAAVAFAGFHLGSELLPIFACGLFAGLLTAATGALMPAILAHATYNLLVVLWL